MNIERIEWIDSAVNSGWALFDDWKEEMHDPIRITSYGFMVKETEDYVILAQNYGTNPEQVCNTIAIPKGCITKRETIEPIL